MSDPEATTLVEGPTVPEPEPATPEETKTPDPTAAAPKAAEDPAPVDDKRKKARDAALRAAGAKLLSALEGPDVGLKRPQSAIVAAHLALAECKNLTEFAAYGRSQAVEFAQRLRRFNPIAWRQLIAGNIDGFVAALRLGNVRVGRKPLGDDADRGDEHESDLEAYEEFTAVLSAP